MSKFLNLFKKLIEESIFMVDDDTNFRGKSPVLKNPTLDEYISFKKNTKYNAIRGIGIDNDIYIIDANSGIHNELAGKVLEHLGYDLSKINQDDYINGTFKEDEYNNFSCNSNKDNKRLKELCINRKHRNISNETYFDLENEYKDYEINNCDENKLLSFEDWLKERK